MTAMTLRSGLLLMQSERRLNPIRNRVDESDLIPNFSQHSRLKVEAHSERVKRVGLGIGQKAADPSKCGNRRSENARMRIFLAKLMAG